MLVWVNWKLVVWLLLLSVSCATSTTRTPRTRTSTTPPPPLPLVLTPSASPIEQPCCASFLPRGKQRQHHVNDKFLWFASSSSSYQRFIDPTYDEDTTVVYRRHFSLHNRLGTTKTTTTTTTTSRNKRHRLSLGLPLCMSKNTNNNKNSNNNNHLSLLLDVDSDVLLDPRIRRSVSRLVKKRALARWKGHYKTADAY